MPFGEWHSGEHVTVIVRRSLVMNLPSESEAAAAAAGAGRGVGGLSHQRHREWRQYCDDRRVEDSQAFVDGDLVQLFLELSHKQQEQVAKAIGVKLSECIRRVEEAGRRIH